VAGSWPNLYAVNGTPDALTALNDLDDWRFDDHGQVTLDDGTIALTAYGTDAAAEAALAAQPSVTIELIFTGDQMMQRIDDDIENRP
jgi:hypothetical protein